MRSGRTLNDGILIPSKYTFGNMVETIATKIDVAMLEMSYFI